MSERVWTREEVERWYAQNEAKRGSAEEQRQRLRDEFAMAALQGLIAGLFSGNNAGFTPKGNVVAAYEYADLMMAQREKA